MRTDPKRFLFRMMLFLAFVGTICTLLFAPLKSAFMGNPALNSVILANITLFNAGLPINALFSGANNRVQIVPTNARNNIIRNKKRLGSVRMFDSPQSLPATISAKLL